MAAIATLAGCSQKGPKCIDVELKQASKTITYKAAYLVDGKEATLSDQTIRCEGEDEVAVLVANGGKLTLKNCTIIKTGDGKNGGGQGQGTPPPMPEGEKPDGAPEGMPPGGEPGPGGPGAGEDSYNFYGTNSAVVALGKGSSIVLDGCKVETDAEYANAVFSADEAVITVKNGITISTKKNSSRGLYATCAGVVNAEGVVNIDTKGAHCAALATDRGGGFVTVGSKGTKDASTLNTAGDGSPSIYSTGDIKAYNIIGRSGASQAIVVEGKNSVTVEDSDLQGNDPSYGGIMLYQSFSGDAETGIAHLRMNNCKVQDNGGMAMLLVTNTEATADFAGCTFTGKDGSWNEDSYLVMAKNCNTASRSWGKAGSNGGNVKVSYAGQPTAGKILAKESDSVIEVTAAEGTTPKNIKVDPEGKGKASVSEK